MKESFNLPVESVINELKEALETASGAVLQAPPGAGKTTLVPLALLDETWLRGRRILMLQPRRLAVRASARRMADMLGETVGETVGYRVRMDSRVGPGTRIEVITEGILTRFIQNDPSLEGVGMVIFDEFHERGLDSDLGLALSIDLRDALREDLRILVMSATLDGGPVAGLLGSVPVISSAGERFDVVTRYLENPLARTIEQETASAVMRAVRSETGSILVFLPGVAQIRRVSRLLEDAGLAPDVTVTRLFGNLPKAEQDRAIRPCPPGIRKIVLTTSIAETSLTIEGVRIVIDSGLMKVMRHDPKRAMGRLETVRVSKASADQRRGRAGRTGPGVCYRLWTEAEHNHLTPHTAPEIRDTDLSALALELALWGVKGPDELAWLDPPPPAAFSQAEDLLKKLNAVDDDGKITGHGRQIAGIALHPRLAHMIRKGAELGMSGLACDLASLLGERDIIKKSGFRDSDLRTRIEILGNIRKNRHAGFRDHEIETSACHRIIKSSDFLLKRLGKSPGDRNPNQSGQLLALAYPDRIAKARAGETGRYLLASGRGACFMRYEPLCSEAYIVAAHLDGGNRESAIYLAAPVWPDELDALFAEDIRTIEAVFWDNRKKRVSASVQRRLGELILEEKPLEKPDPDRMASAFVSGVRQQGTDVLPWNSETRMWQARVLFLRDVFGDSWPDVSDSALEAGLEQWLAPWVDGMTGLKDLERLNLMSVLSSRLDWRQQRDLDELAPLRITVPSGSHIRIDYLNGGQPVLPVRLQEMFGLRKTPAIAGNRVPLTIHLLSPAHRVVQVTRDLAGFWENTYHEVKKDLKGRYPKHFWPDDPLDAEPTGRAKRKK